MRFAIVLLLVSVSPISAQAVLDGHGYGTGVVASVGDIWDEFERSCTDVLTDPAGFVTSHPTVGPLGLDAIQRSEDGQVLVLDYMSDKGVFRQMEIIGVPGELHILCQANGGEETTWTADPSLYPTMSEKTYREFVSMLGALDIVPVGGRIPVRMPTMGAMTGGHVPDNQVVYILGFQAPIAGDARFVYANLFGTNVSLTGHYVIRAEDVAEDASSTGSSETATAAESQASPPQAKGSAGAMRSVAEVCLRNYRTPEAALPALEAAGMMLSPTEDQTFEISGPGIWGVVTTGTEIYCTVQSPDVTLDAAREIGADLVSALFPGLAQPGAPEGGQGPCDGYSIFAPRQLIWLRYAQAGNSGECKNDGTSAIIIN